MDAGLSSVEAMAMLKDLSGHDVGYFILAEKGEFPAKEQVAGRLVEVPHRRNEEGTPRTYLILEAFWGTIQVEADPDTSCEIVTE